MTTALVALVAGAVGVGIGMAVAMLLRRAAPQSIQSMMRDIEDHSITGRDMEAALGAGQAARKRGERPTRRRRSRPVA